MKCGLSFTPFTLPKQKELALSKVQLECFCGTVKGQLNVPSNKKAFHVHCLCCDCQNFAAFLKNEEKILDDHGGSELFQTHPCYIELTQGKDKLACAQFNEKGLLRWHTSCCNTPVANTMRSPNVPFAGVSTKFMKFASESEKDKTLGPVIMKAFGKYAKGPMPPDAHETFPKSFLPKIIKFMIRGYFASRKKANLFFDKQSPVAIPVTINDNKNSK